MPQKKTLDDFVRQATIVHGDKYCYDKVNYVNNRTKVRVGCKKHGYFWITPRNLLQGHGCAKCGKESMAIKKTESNDSFLSKAKQVHGDKYDYSKSRYTKNNQKVCIICPIHGEFWQIPYAHLSGKGCSQCGLKKRGEKTKLPLETWLKKSRENHSEQYDYTNVFFENVTDYVQIGCPIHGVFIQQAHSHMRGNGCPLCKKHSKGEDIIRKILVEYNIEHERQFRISNDNLLCPCRFFLVDFYLPKYNLFIEYNGAQHYRPIKWWGGEANFEEQQERDFALRQYCKERKIKLLEISYKDFGKIENILKKELKIKTT